MSGVFGAGAKGFRANVRSTPEGEVADFTGLESFRATPGAASLGGIADEIRRGTDTSDATGNTPMRFPIWAVSGRARRNGIRLRGDGDELAPVLPRGLRGRTHEQSDDFA